MGGTGAPADALAELCGRGGGDGEDCSGCCCCCDEDEDGDEERLRRSAQRRDDEAVCWRMSAETDSKLLPPPAMSFMPGDREKDEV